MAKYDFNIGEMAGLKPIEEKEKSEETAVDNQPTETNAEAPKEESKEAAVKEEKSDDLIIPKGADRKAFSDEQPKEEAKEEQAKQPESEESQDPEAESQTEEIDLNEYDVIPDNVSLEESEPEPEISVSEHFSNMNTYFEENVGLSYNDFNQLKEVDYNSMDDESIIQEYRSLINPTLEEDKIINSIETKYHLLFASDEELEQMGVSKDDIRIRQQEAQWDEEIAQAKIELQEAQNNILEAGNNLEWNYNLNTNNNQQNDQQLAEQTELLRNAFTESLSAYDKETIEIKDGKGKVLQTIEYTVSPESRQDLLGFAMNPYSEFIDQNNNIDTEGYIKSVVRNKNFDQIVKAIWDQAKSTTKEELVKDIDNIDLKKKDVKVHNEKPKESIHRQINRDKYGHEVNI